MIIHQVKIKNALVGFTDLWCYRPASVLFICRVTDLSFQLVLGKNKPKQDIRIHKVKELFLIFI